MELFKENKVNPVGGCLPILITIPLFVGFFAMLQSTAELRFAPFLWARTFPPPTRSATSSVPRSTSCPAHGRHHGDPDAPHPTPTTDNMQMKIMQFMPIIFTLFCYTFSCALALYSTVNGLFTIVQQLVVNKMKDEPVVWRQPPPVGRPRPREAREERHAQRRIEVGESLAGDFLAPESLKLAPTPTRPMAGHNKWSKVKRLKAVTDSRKGKVFSRISRDITLAAKAGGRRSRQQRPPAHPRPQGPRGQHARRQRRPRHQEGHRRAARRRVRGNHLRGLRPRRRRVHRQATTDNKTRAAQDVRARFSPSTAATSPAPAPSPFSFSTPASSSSRKKSIAEDALMEIALDAGADDVLSSEQGFEVRCAITPSTASPMRSRKRASSPTAPKSPTSP
jgi:hypothetical protein